MNTTDHDVAVQHLTVQSHHHAGNSLCALFSCTSPGMFFFSLYQYIYIYIYLLLYKDSKEMRRDCSSVELHCRIKEFTVCSQLYVHLRNFGEIIMAGEVDHEDPLPSSRQKKKIQVNAAAVR